MKETERLSTLETNWKEERDRRAGYADDNEDGISNWGGDSFPEYEAGYQRGYADAITRVLIDLGTEPEEEE